MNIRFHQNFVRQYRKLKAEQKRKFKERRDLFLIEPYHPLLNNHALHGTYMGYRSINIGGDLRAVYRRLDNDTALFAAIGRHSALYR